MHLQSSSRERTGSRTRQQNLNVCPNDELPPARFHCLPKHSTTFPKHHPMADRDQGFKLMILWGTFHLQTTTGSITYIEFIFTAICVSQDKTMFFVLLKYVNITQIATHLQKDTGQIARPCLETTTTRKHCISC